MQIECVVDSRSALGEGAVWDVVDQALWWVDIYGHLVHRFDPVTGRNDGWDIGERVGCLSRRDTGLILATETGFHAFDPDTGTKTAIHDPEPDLTGNRFNDGATDRQGRFWAGTMRDDGTKSQRGSFYRLDHDRSVTRMMDGFYTTNGTAFSPDGTVMYVAESHADIRTIWAFDYDTDTGIPHNRRVFVDTHGFAGRPDGGTVDADGCYWMAGVGGWQVMRFTPDGRVDLVIDMPVEKPTKPMWGGAGLDVLYVTSLKQGLDPDRPQPQAGSLFAITGLAATGVPETRFAG